MTAQTFFAPAIPPRLKIKVVLQRQSLLDQFGADGDAEYLGMNDGDARHQFFVVVDARRLQLRIREAEHIAQTEVRTQSLPCVVVVPVIRKSELGFDESLALIDGSLRSFGARFSCELLVGIDMGSSLIGSGVSTESKTGQVI